MKPLARLLSHCEPPGDLLRRPDPRDDVEAREQIFEALDAFEDLVAVSGLVSRAYGQLQVHADSSGAIEPGDTCSTRPSPQAKTPEELAEERRALLVMFSRARLGLVISRAETRVSKADNVYTITPSPWWTDTASAFPLTLDQLRQDMATR